MSSLISGGTQNLDISKLSSDFKLGLQGFGILDLELEVGISEVFG